MHLEEGAVLKFSTDPKQYLPVVLTRFEGTECMNYSPFLYAFEQNNIAVTGTGVLDGQADSEHWWPMRAKAKADADALVAMADKDVPVSQRIFGEGHYLRPNFFQPYRCNNVLIEGIGIRSSPMWELNPVLCRNVTVRNVKIASFGPNNDGCDPESSTGVLVEGCVFETGDDCIAIKSGRNRDGRRVGVACENIVIRDCTMKDGHGGVSLGSEGSGGIHNVFVDNCRMNSPNLQRALRLKMCIRDSIEAHAVTLGERHRLFVLFRPGDGIGIGGIHAGIALDADTKLTALHHRHDPPGGRERDTEGNQPGAQHLGDLERPGEFRVSRAGESTEPVNFDARLIELRADGPISIGREPGRDQRRVKIAFPQTALHHRCDHGIDEAFLRQSDAREDVALQSELNPVDDGADLPGSHGRHRQSSYG